MPHWLKLNVFDREDNVSDELKEKLGISTQTEDKWMVFPYAVDLSTVRIRDYQAYYFDDRDVVIVNFTDGIAKIVDEPYSKFINKTISTYNEIINKIDVNNFIAESIVDVMPVEEKAAYIKMINAE